MEHMNILFTENTFIWLIIAINGDKVKKNAYGELPSLASGMKNVS